MVKARWLDLTMGFTGFDYARKDGWTHGTMGSQGFGWNRRELELQMQMQ